jgi:glycosyltransferase involved in cell wall biosynthesis
MLLSVIIPVHNGSAYLPACLSALESACPAQSEIIVVDDASMDDSFSIGSKMGAQAFRLPVNSGPAAARNYGARHARGDILFFVDADVLVAQDAPAKALRRLLEQPELAAVFGSYDARPQAKGFVSQYRNLLHHFVHQNGNPDASTFWAGCGAIRRSIFEEAGGFDEKRYPHPSIEDIELGYRLRRAGHRIFLDKTLQAKHLKHWSLVSLINTDVRRRAVPWSRLILETKFLPNDLNVRWDQRFSFALLALASMFMLLGIFQIEFLLFAVVAFAGVILLNRELYLFFYNERGLLFAIASTPLLILYYLYSGLSYLYVRTGFLLRSLVSF